MKPKWLDLSIVKTRNAWAGMAVFFMAIGIVTSLVFVVTWLMNLIEWVT